MIHAGDNVIYAILDISMTSNLRGLVGVPGAICRPLEIYAVEVNEPPHGVLGSREHRGYNYQEAGSRGTNLGSREQRKNSREHQGKEIE